MAGKVVTASMGTRLRFDSDETLSVWAQIHFLPWAAIGLESSLGLGTHSDVPPAERSQGVSTVTATVTVAARIRHIPGNAMQSSLALRPSLQTPSLQIVETPPRLFDRFRLENRSS
jgi:hypothetical protein